MNLDEALAHKLGIPVEKRNGQLYIAQTDQPWMPTRDWLQIGRLLERNRIRLYPKHGNWVAKSGVYRAEAGDPREAVARVILAG